MKIYVFSQPKTGNVWVRNLLQKTYGLEDLNEKLKDDIPETPLDFVAIADNWKSREYIFQQHYFPRPEMVEYIGANDGHVVTMLRDPYETFVSFYFYVNRLPQQFEGRIPMMIYGKPIDHPDVLRFLRENYKMHLNMSVQWVRSRKSNIVRYENLLADPVGVLRDLVGNLKVMDDSVINHAVEECSAVKVKKRGGWRADHIRSAREKTWDKHLTETHLEVFREHYGDWINELGYEVA